MQKKDLRIDALLAMRTSKYSTIDMVRILDTVVWRKAPSNYDRNRTQFTLAPGQRVGTRKAYGMSDYGYPVLERVFKYSTSMTPEQHAAAYAFIKTAEVTLADLLDEDGQVKHELIPEGVRLTVVDTRHLLGGWATVKHEEDMQEKAEEENRRALKQQREDRENRFGKAQLMAARILGPRGPFGGPQMNTGGTVTMSLKDFETLMARVR
jgi:hypothetical protein